MGNTASECFTWKFHRLGGLDQVTLRTAEELQHLHELNPKLWTALSCPATGLEFNERALALIDANNDGRIRIPEVLDSVAWLTRRLADPASMIDPPDAMPLAAITNDTPEGKRLCSTAKAVLAALGKPDADAITHEDVAAALKHAAKNAFNGDGVLPPLAEFGAEARMFIEDALAVVGGVDDANGQPGINADIANAFVKTLDIWRETMNHAATPVGDDTAEAWKLIQELEPKVVDYFLRCEMAAFAPWSSAAPREDEKNALGDIGLLDASLLAALPLARIEADRPLSMTKGINPAWRERMGRLAALAAPLLPDTDAVTREDWAMIRGAFVSFEAALAQKPDIDAVAVTHPPISSPGQISPDRMTAYRKQNTLNRVLELIEKDAAAPAAATDIADLERLVLYHRHLHRLLMNFVSFYDFYSLRHKAAFQSGTLYLDGRSCRLCLPVADIAKHSTLAALSQLCLVYCQCSRRKDAPATGEETMTIVAAFTAGNADMLVAGRNGVFVDAAGRDWDATVVKVVPNPISIREAMWDPYRRMARMIAEQISKFTAARQADVTKAISAQTAGTVAGKPPQSFDIGKSMGIFAAIGLALGALGTAAASILKSLFALSWWQIPLVFLGLFLIISGPSMALAWLKLRKRTLSPLLDASGWAVNSIAPINFTLGKQLTSIAELPCNATRSFNDPLRRTNPWPFIMGAAVGIAAAGVAAYLWLMRPELVRSWLSAFEKL